MKESERKRERKRGESERERERDLELIFFRRKSDLDDKGNLFI